MTQYDFVRAVVGNNKYDIDGGVAAPVQLAIPNEAFRIVFKGTDVAFIFENALSAAQQTTLTSAVGIYKAAGGARELSVVKDDLIAQITSRCTQNMEDDAGFEYPANSGNFFGVGLRSRVYWNTLRSGAAGLVYPFTVRTKNGRRGVALANAVEVPIAYDRLVAKVVALQVAADAAIGNVIAAATIAAALAAAAVYLDP